MNSRQLAKQGITGSEDQEPEVQNAITVGHQLQLDLLREKNRHKEALQAAELGRIGRLVGAESAASITLASAVVALGFIGVITGYIIAAVRPGSQEFWGKEIGWSYGAISSAMAFVFGRSTKK